MTRWSLTAVLLATQLLSWSGAPLYVCLANDGSVGMHLGAGDCCATHNHDACHHDGTCTAKTGKCKCHEHATTVAHHKHNILNAAVHGVANQTCDCTHIQISLPQGPSIVSKATTANLEVELSLSITTIHSDFNFAPTANALNLQPALFIGCSSLPLTQLETVALRC